MERRESITKPTQERRKYIRVGAPLPIRVIIGKKSVHELKIADISPIGLRFVTGESAININDEIELKIEIPGALGPVHAKAKVVWKKKLSTENGAPYDIGCEFTRVEEDNKNTFLKYFCDLLYRQEEA